MNTNNNNQQQQQQQSRRFHISFGVGWEKTVPNKQTLFPLWGEKEERKARKGIPPEGIEYALRATKGVNMHPYPLLQILYPDGSKYTEEEEVKITLVNSINKLPPAQGSCNCTTGQPILAESKPFQLIERQGDMYARVKGGVLELSKLQIGCCTGARGHGVPFCIRVEFIRENSPLKGRVAHSLPIEVGAKGPFAKIFIQKSQLQHFLEQEQQQQQQQHQPPPQPSSSSMIPSSSSSSSSLNNINHHTMMMVKPSSLNNNVATSSPSMMMHNHGGGLALTPLGTLTTNTSTTSTAAALMSSYNYEGAEQMMKLLARLNIGKYAHLFAQQEIDINAFLELTEEDLNVMGITKMGPKIKILREIAKLKRERDHLLLTMSNSNNNNTLAGRYPQLPPIPDTIQQQSSSSLFPSTPSSLYGNNK